MRSAAFGRAARVFALLAFATALAACAHVPAYDRGKIAHPTMATDDIAGAAETHVRSVQEGAQGGGFGIGGGCGCN